MIDAAYAVEHPEPAYALTGHGAQGATVEWAAVIGRPSEFSREWSYTALFRARTRTNLYLIVEPAAPRRERELYAPHETAPTAQQALADLCLAMRRREAEPLAIHQAHPQELRPTSQSPLPLDLLPEAGAERALTELSKRRPSGQMCRPEPGWMALRREQDQLKRGPRLAR